MQHGVTKTLKRALGNVGRAAGAGYQMYRKAYDDSQKTERALKAKSKIRKGFF